MINYLNKSVTILIKNIFIALLFLTFSTQIAHSAKKKNEKDCVYCLKYKKVKDWPIEKRPKEYIYEEVKYPEGMFSKKQLNANKGKLNHAGSIVYKRFVSNKFF